MGMKLLNNSFKIDKSLTKKRPDKTGRFPLWLGTVGESRTKTPENYIILAHKLKDLFIT